MENLDEQILLYYDKVCAMEQLQKNLEYNNRTITRKKLELEELHTQLEKETQDVVELEQLSWQSLFTRILGNRAEQLEKERQEYLMVFLKYERFEDEVASLEYERDILEQKISQSFNAEEILDKLMLKKVHQLNNLPENIKGKITEITENLRNHHYRLREIDQAKKQCNHVLAGAEKLTAQLEKVKWGFANKVYKKSSSVHKKNSDAQNIRKSFNYVSNKITKLYKELNDISTKYNLHYDFILKAFNDFDNYFFDGLMSDWIVQGKIDHSLNIITTAKDRVVRIHSMLETDTEKTEKYIEEEKLHQAKIIAENTRRF